MTRTPKRGDAIEYRGRSSVEGEVTGYGPWLAGTVASVHADDRGEFFVIRDFWQARRLEDEGELWRWPPGEGAA